MPTSRLPSLQDVARLAGVSAMTVCRALHNSPRVAPGTRDRIRHAVDSVGYHPDLRVAQLMSAVRGRRPQEAHTVLGVIRDNPVEDELHDDAYQYVALSDIRSRAEQLGYLVEEFSLGRKQIGPRRLAAILRARGIEGVIVSPQSSRAAAAQLDYSPFAAVTFGYGLPHPPLHRASTNMTQGIHDAADELYRRDYRRVGVAITEWIDARSNHTYSGALLHWQRKIPARERVPLFLFPGNNPAKGKDAFCAWVKRHRPDGLISFNTHVPDWLTGTLKLRLADDVGLVVHDWTPAMMGFAGIDHRRPQVAAAAVDLLSSQLMHHERGVPEVPRQVLVPPAWRDGASLRPPR